MVLLQWTLIYNKQLNYLWTRKIRLKLVRSSQKLAFASINYYYSCLFLSFVAAGFMITGHYVQSQSTFKCKILVKASICIQIKRFHLVVISSHTCSIFIRFSLCFLRKLMLRCHGVGGCDVAQPSKKS